MSEAFGFRKGVNLDFRRAPIFLGLFSALIAVGAAVALIPNVPLIQLLVAIQALNGILLPIILVFLLLLINDRRVAADADGVRDPPRVDGDEHGSVRPVSCLHATQGTPVPLQSARRYANSKPHRL